MNTYQVHRDHGIPVVGHQGVKGRALGQDELHARHERNERSVNTRNACVYMHTHDVCMLRSINILIRRLDTHDDICWQSIHGMKEMNSVNTRNA